MVHQAETSGTHRIDDEPLPVPANVEPGGSDALIDATVAHGDLSTIRQSVTAQFSAGATRVVVIPLASQGRPDLDLLTALANAP